MWYVHGNDLKMCEGDFGVELPITISGTTLTASDEIRVTIKKSVNGDTLVTKDYGNISQNTVRFSLTSAESALLPVGTYVDSLDWYQSGHFMCNIVEAALFKVVEKA